MSPASIASAIVNATSSNDFIFVLQIMCVITIFVVIIGVIIESYIANKNLQKSIKEYDAVCKARNNSKTFL